jgi:hypothetical protein
LNISPKGVRRLQMDLHNKAVSRWCYAATIALCLSLEWHLIRDAVGLYERGELLSESLAPLRATLASQISAARDQKDRIASRLGAFSELRRKSASNHARILRMLRMLVADRRNLGPSDPIKVNLGYKTAAMGHHIGVIQNAAYLTACRTVEKYQLSDSYGPLLTRLAMKNVDRSHLIDLILDLSTAAGEARAIASQEGLSPELASEAANAAAAASQGEFEEYLGGENLAVYKAYLPVVAGQYSADQFQERLSYSDTQMTAEQYEKYSALAGASGDRNLLEGTISDDTVSAAQAFLSPSQLQVLVGLERERQSGN